MSFEYVFEDATTGEAFTIQGEPTDEHARRMLSDDAAALNLYKLRRDRGLSAMVALEQVLRLRLFAEVPK